MAINVKVMLDVALRHNCLIRGAENKPHNGNTALDVQSCGIQENVCMAKLTCIKLRNHPHYIDDMRGYPFLGWTG